MRKEFFNIGDQNLDIYMITCGYEDCVDHFVSAPHIRDYYLIHYVTKGSGYFETENHTFPVAAGDAFTMHPGQIATYYSPDEKDTWSFCWVGFSGSRAKEYMELTGNTGYIKSAADPQFFKSVMHCLEYAEENERCISQLRLNACVLDCLFALTGGLAQKPVGTKEHAEKAIRYIEYNYMNGITPRDVYTFLNLDRTYFFRIFKKHTGISPEQYIMQYRIRRSLELLQYSTYSISEIASFVGISDVCYFSRLFRKIMNMTPTEYRKTL